MELFGVKWVGVTAENGQKLLLSVAFIAVVLCVSRLSRWLVGVGLQRTDHAGVQTRFWTRQAINLLAAVVLILGLLSIWFNDPTRLATALGLVSAGLAFALQQPVTSIAGYFVVLRGETFNVGDRISMGGVRGDVLRLGFIQTTIMEMGQPPSEQGEPGMWVKSRQATGRIVTVSNSRVFSDPVFNYTRDFPFIWEEMTLPISYTADRAKAESILLDAARRHAGRASEIAAGSMRELETRFGVERLDLDPRVFFRMTDNWLELTVRFIVTTHSIRSIKDAMSRHIVEELERAGIGIASATYDIVGLPTVNVRMLAAERRREA